MKKYIALFIASLLFVASASFAQTPRIDSIAVDEDKGELVLHGNFQNSSFAIVFVDSVLLPVTMASDTVIRATIALSGKGSTGWVTESSKGVQSNEKLLTYWHMQLYREFSHHYSDGGLEVWFNNDTMHFRSDILSHNNSEYPISFSKLSKYRAYAGGNDGIHGYKYTGPHYDSSGILPSSVYFDGNKGFYFSFTDPQGNDEATIRMDNNYQIITDHSHDNYCQSEGYICFSWSAISPTDFPPSSPSVPELTPNPSILQVHLSSDPISTNGEVTVILQDEVNLRIEIINILGNTLSSVEKNLSVGINKLPLNFSTLLPGIYICRLQAGKQIVSMRFVKK